MNILKTKTKNNTLKNIFNLINNKKPIVILGHSYIDFKVKLKIIINGFLSENNDMQFLKLSLSNIKSFESYFKENVFSKPTLILINYNELKNHSTYFEYINLLKENKLPANVFTLTEKQYIEEDLEHILFDDNFKAFLIKNKH